MKNIIEIKHLTKIFKTKDGNVQAINDINLTIEEKDIYGIIGLSGAGKSTLIRCLNFLEKPSFGTVIVGDDDLSKLSRKKLRLKRQRIGMIFQNFNLFEERTAIRNILYPLEIAHINKEERLKRAYDLLELVGLSDKANAYPSQLSGGQKQRIAIARALALNPEVLLCDEATSALDPTTTIQILKLLKDINQQFGITIILITHSMSVVEEICNKVAIIDNATIKESGLVKDIFSNPKTPIAKSLIFPNLNLIDKEYGRMLLRLSFKGRALDAVIAKLILNTKVLINIIEGNLKTKDALIYGEMLIQLPDNETDILKVKNFLTIENIEYEESLTGE